MKPLTWTNATRKLGELRGWEHNPRQITKEQAARLVHSLEAFGQFQTIAITPDNIIVDGHQRQACWAAAEKYGADYVVDVRIASRELTDKERAKLTVLAHRGATGEWNWDALANLPGVDVDDLTDWGFDEAELIGSGEFDTPEPTDAEPQIDRAAELNKKWQVKPGDLWRIGEHRLLCGDSTKREDVERLLGSAGAQMMVTDPPYGVDYDADWRNKVDNFGRSRIGKVVNDDRIDWTPAFKNFNGDVAYVWHAGIHAASVAQQLESCDFEIRYQLIWVKQNQVMSRGRYHWKHEPLWYAVRKGKTASATEDRTQTTVWDIANANPCGGGTHDDMETTHSTQKPLECMARPIRNHTLGIIYDPFLGSGTTMVACENLGRKCRGIEISPDYCAVILERMQTAFPKLTIERALVTT